MHSCGDVNGVPERRTPGLNAVKDLNRNLILGSVGSGANGFLWCGPVLMLQTNGAHHLSLSAMLAEASKTSR